MWGNVKMKEKKLYTCEFCKKDFVNISYQMFCNHVKHRCELNPNMTKIIIKKNIT